MGLLDLFKRIEPDKNKSPFLHTAYDAFFTFAFAPNSVTKGGVHIRDGIDLKRTMFHVVIALQLCYLFGTYNIGHQHFVAAGQYFGFLEGFHLKLAHGLIKLLPIFIWTHVVGLGIEFYFAAKKGHAVEEGFLVSGALIPLIMPPDLPIWILCIAVAFAVIVGKEAFGGTGMNIWNVALLARVFVFFAYPTSISGDEVWVAGFEALKGGAAVDYGWWHTGFFNTIFGWMNLEPFNASLTVVDGYSGATPLALAYQGGWENVTNTYTATQLWWGTIPGSIGETSKPFIIFGILFLIATGIASWRIIVGTLIGGFVMGMILNVWGATPFMTVPWYYHAYIGSFLFAAAFMATDPVTASTTQTGKWIYGFLIGFIGIIVRVMNPAYPEGWMLAILFLNTFAPLIDHFVLSSNMKKRLKSA
ncbi:MAG TPA: NADH:ubiquinone reductase (Na(+)-transporting) subunit B [Saprospiraceae bacterium]|nr:NADH:ubiquinone reductase (Na(+)-transporting) subunit B [Saprospiraceae bacterium]